MASLFKPGTFNAGDAAGDTYILIEGLEGSSGNDLLDGNAGDNILIGQDGDDTLNGRDAADTLLGGDGDDTLYGGMGDDTLTGGAGADVLSGGAGSDTFAFTAPEEGGDTLFSFTRGEDTIRLSQAGFAGLELGVLSADDLGSGPPDDSMDRLYLTGNDLFYDGDGNGSDAAIRLFTLDGGASIVASDILIV